MPAGHCGSGRRVRCLFWPAERQTRGPEKTPNPPLDTQRLSPFPPSAGNCTVQVTSTGPLDGDHHPERRGVLRVNFTFRRPSRTRHCTRSCLRLNTLAPCDVFGPPKTRSGAADQAFDPVFFLASVSAFPLARKNTGSRARTPAPSPLRRPEKVRGPVGESRGWNLSNPVVICDLDRCAVNALRPGNA